MAAIEEEEVDMDWACVLEWVASMGDVAIRALRLDFDPDYQQWLAGALGQTEVPDWTTAQTVSLQHLMAGYDRAVGYREVKLAGLKNKLKDRVLAKVWRTWDVAKVCHVPEILLGARHTDNSTYQSHEY